MNTVKKILVPVDLSDNSLHTTLYAIEYAKHHSARVIVFYNTIVPLIFGESANYGDGIGKINEEKMRQAYQLEDTQAEAKLTNFKKRVADGARAKHLSNVNVEYSVDFGALVSDINIIVESDLIDMIMVGIADENSPSKLSKNISELLLRKSKIPVFAIPENASYHTFKEVIYATNFKKHSIEEIEQFLAIVKPLNVKTHCIHIGDMLNEEQEMEDIVKPHFRGNKSIDFFVLPDNGIVDSLSDFIKDHEVQLIALHAHRTTIWGQIFGENKLESILHHVDIPILAIH